MQTPPTQAQAMQARRAFGFVSMSAVLPGSVQLFAGRPKLGRFATRLFGGVLVAILLVVVSFLLFRNATLDLLLHPWVTTAIRVFLWVLFFFWLFLLVDAWRLARPIQLRRQTRLGLTLTAMLIALCVGSVTALASSALQGAGNLGEVLSGGGDNTENEGRFNILLLGADASATREGLRPDSINVASIDAATGRTILFGLPRNLEGVRFPESSPLREVYPNGFDCPNSECMLNGIYTLGEEHADLYPGKDAGLIAMKEAVGETLGLELNYYAMVDMGGFQSLVDAMGGIRLNIGKAIPIGGGSSKISGYIEPGTNVELDGYHALWFARSRAESDDFERMVRQKCVMAAMAKQLDPMTLATKFVQLSEAGKDILRTDVGRGEIVTLAELAMKAKDLPIVSQNFSPPLIHSGNPDFELIKKTVAEKIAEADRKDEASKGNGSPAASPTAKKATGAPTDSASPTATASKSAAPQPSPSETQAPVCSA